MIDGSVEFVHAGGGAVHDPHQPARIRLDELDGQTLGIARAFKNFRNALCLGRPGDQDEHFCRTVDERAVMVRRQALTSATKTATQR